jgi:hypothetical protein
LLEERLVLSFFSQIGGCEPVGENGRLIMQVSHFPKSLPKNSMKAVEQ